MSDITFCTLPDDCRPLLGKFYREHQSSMRAASKGEVWVARQPDIIGALSLSPVADGHWLTALFVAPARGTRPDRRCNPLAGRPRLVVLPS